MEAPERSTARRGRCHGVGSIETLDASGRDVLHDGDAVYSLSNRTVVHIDYFHGSHGGVPVCQDVEMEDDHAGHELVAWHSDGFVVRALLTALSRMRLLCARRAKNYKKNMIRQVLMWARARQKHPHVDSVTYD